MKFIFIALTIVFSNFVYAQDCPQLAGDFQVKIGNVLQYLSIVQNECKSFEFSYEYPNQTFFKKIVNPDNLEKIIMDDGDRELKETANIETIKIGDKEVVTLHIERSEYSRISEETIKTQIYFYTGENQTSKNLIERRDEFNEAGEKLRRVYIGYISK